jgi:hypothetical protein
MARRSQRRVRSVPAAASTHPDPGECGEFQLKSTGSVQRSDELRHCQRGDAVGSGIGAACGCGERGFFSRSSCAAAAPSCCSSAAVRLSSRSSARALFARLFAIGIWMLMLPSSAPSQNVAINATTIAMMASVRAELGGGVSFCPTAWLPAAGSAGSLDVSFQFVIIEMPACTTSVRITTITMALATDRFTA